MGDDELMVWEMSAGMGKQGIGSVNVHRGGERYQSKFEGCAVRTFSGVLSSNILWDTSKLPAFRPERNDARGLDNGFLVSKG